MGFRFFCPNDAIIIIAFFTLSEYRNKVMGGFIAILKGPKGEKWLRFPTTLRKVATSSSVLGVDNRAKQRVPLLGNVVSGKKGSFLKVLKKSPQNLVVHSSSEGQREVRGVVGEVVEKLDLQSNHLPKGRRLVFQGRRDRR